MARPEMYTMRVSYRTDEAGSHAPGILGWKTRSVYSPHAAEVHGNSVRAWAPRDSQTVQPADAWTGTGRRRVAYLLASLLTGCLWNDFTADLTGIGDRSVDEICEVQFCI